MPQAYFFPSAETPRNAAREIGAESERIKASSLRPENSRVFLRADEKNKTEAVNVFNL